MTEIETGVHWDANNIMNDYTNGSYEQNEDDLDIAANNSAKLFERSRIKALAGKILFMWQLNVDHFPFFNAYNFLIFFTDERESVQKKTFCKWVNSHLARVGCKIQDLYVDLRDGKMLIKLLEVLSGERLVGLQIYIYMLYDLLFYLSLLLLNTYF